MFYVNTNRLFLTYHIEGGLLGSTTHCLGGPKSTETQKYALHDTQMQAVEYVAGLMFNTEGRASLLLT